MPATVVRHVMEPALLPGATGRADLRSAERAALVGSLSEALARSGATGSSPEDGGTAVLPVPSVLVVAPARRSLRTTDGRADLGALGLDRAALPSGLDARALGTGSPETPSLDVVAGVAVTLLALAGWHGPVETVERGGPEAETVVLDDVLAGRRLVLVALAAHDAVLPAGAHPGLAAGQQQVWALAERWLG
ncbi:hypothetical protein Sked_23140 [Sanguibacter keddieii DSM 10542]|uniref:Uncharacterized protein n=1 Tax=Sanguibacter keddieii (strain ATCC 51767 / DSM 10542 / NCFB 3025 / ST-74) TaxID=446469 RepID=D1BJ35_SANKS|nr:hypothetical protein [Sanguibacter keddieii]ACZ22229.1 hypothetical protein Sked_23140 [Sanguibacter keddieii DSM 10542]